MDQQDLSKTQFGARAAAYLTSKVHAAGTDLERLQGVAGAMGKVRALDLGCGAGHASFALARGGAARVTACDPSEGMLAVVAREAAARGHEAIHTRAGSAERLPFEDGSFDLVVTRFSAHHWPDVPRALDECARVLAAGGRLIVIDVIAPEAPILDTPLQVIEFLRDGSHVRNYRPSEWRAMLGRAGFAEPRLEAWRLPLEFDAWVARIGTPPARIAALRAVFSSLSREMREYLELGERDAFSIEAAWMESDRRRARP